MTIKWRLFMIDIEDRKYSVKIMSDYLGSHGWWRAGDNVGDENKPCELVLFDDGGYAPTFSIVLPKNEGQTFKKVWDELEQNYYATFPDYVRPDFAKWMKRYECNNSLEIKR